LVALPSHSQFNSSGGEIRYQFLYHSGGDFPKDHYRVSLKLYKECTDASELPLSVNFRAAVNNPPTVQPQYEGAHGIGSAGMTRFYITKADQNLCMDNFPPVCYQVGEYTLEDLALDPTMGDYIVYAQGNKRKEAAFVNVNTSGIGKLSGGIMGFTYICRIPGMLGVSFSQPSSPSFRKEYPLILCAGQPFRYDFSAEDPDGDSLVYQFVNSYQGMVYTVPRYPVTASDPPFLSLLYTAGFSGASPLGSGVTIDPASGSISGTAPTIPGKYLINVEVVKYRNGEVVTKHRKEIQFYFNNCSTGARAQLDSTYRNCKGTTIKFQNYSTGNITKYFWDFGVTTTNADTSNVKEPTYTYPAPGIYTVRLFINRGTSLCKDSATATVIVDTGMNASFTALRDISACNQALYNFTNTSSEGSNPITSYAWDFGEVSDPNDKAGTPNSSYLYPTEGNKQVRMIIKNSIGCSDTAFQTLMAFKSLMRAQADTVICHLDTITLLTNTNGYPGTFSWSPNYNIISLTAATPRVFPKKDTAYFVSFTDATGCIARDTVKVKVRDSVSNKIVNLDTTICSFDTLYISTVHDGRSVTWSPASRIIVLQPDGSGIWAFPASTTNLISTAHFGSCVQDDTIMIKVVPKPTVSISNDTTVCLGAPVYLRASGGTYYSWTPASSLSEATIADPVAIPNITTTYKVSVTDTLGCPKPSFASVTVTTFRALYAFAETDTMIVMGEPVQLIGTGGIYYQWSPSQYLSDPNIANPVARPFTDMIYTLKISDNDNCTDSALVHIRTFKDPDIYVPTAFTPNNDGLNDLFRVTPVGFLLDELKIFDRWGNVVFQTRDSNRGWNGTLNGQPLATGTFVWMAKGRNKKSGAIVTKKGQITLIR